MAIKQESQVIELDQIISTYVQSVRLPENIQVAHHEYMLDPVGGKVILMLTVVDNTDLAKARQDLERIQKELKELKTPVNDVP